MRHSRLAGIVVSFFSLLSLPVLSQTYEVGVGKTYASIGATPWASLLPGDTVLIYYRSTPYAEKWVIDRQGTASAPISVRGVLGPNGEFPIIDGSNAITPSNLNFWAGERGVIKIGGSNTPPDTMPSYIVVENLEFRNGRPPYTFKSYDGSMVAYASNAASIYIEKGSNITLRNCLFHDCANGLFCAQDTSNLLVEKCGYYANGMENSATQHNNYTEANGITFQYNYFGPLRATALGNNLKDRSGGCVIRYNWIESGNRELDLVDSGSTAITSSAAYRQTYVYGNTIVEPAGAGNAQVVHFGGDSGNTAMYRKGTMYFYNNTVVSTRTDRSTVFRLSTNEEHCDCRNNILYVTASGSNLAMLDTSGTLDLRNNWTKSGWYTSFSAFSGTLNNYGGNVTGSSPGFVNEGGQDYHLASGSGCINMGTTLASAAQTAYNVTSQYVKHRLSEPRPISGALDIGAYEYASGISVNTAPIVYAGADQTITLPSSATLSGTVSDDGLPNPPAAVTTSWSFVSGPGSVTFGNSQSLSTLAAFSAAGTYTLRLTANDSALTGSNDVVITVNAPSSVTTGTGDGLYGSYYDHMNFSGALRTRIDPQINFDWGTGAPFSGMSADTFSTRWTGQVQPQYSQTYTFYTVSDDGVRLWVNGQLLVDKWRDQAATEFSGSISLTANTRYNIKLEYYDDKGSASIKLLWSSASTPKAIIPRSQLYSSAAAGAMVASRAVNVDDTDGDGLLDEYELGAGFDPNLRDTDSNGTDDGYEIVSGTDMIHLQAQAQWLAERDTLANAPVGLKIASIKLRNSPDDASVYVSGTILRGDSSSNVTVQVADFTQSFTLNENGRAVNDNDSLCVLPARNGWSKFKLVLRNCDATPWATDAGLTADVSIYLDGSVHSQSDVPVK